MAKNILVGRCLSKDMIAAGKRLIQELDRKELPVCAAAWVYDEELARWRLVLSLSEENPISNLDAYQRIQSILLNQGSDEPWLALDHVKVVSPGSLLSRALKKVSGEIITEPGAMFSGRIKDGPYVEDAYIYSLL